MVRHAEVFVGVAGGVGELQNMRLEAVSMSWTAGKKGGGTGNEGDGTSIPGEKKTICKSRL